MESKNMLEIKLFWDSKKDEEKHAHMVTHPITNRKHVMEAMLWL